MANLSFQRLDLNKKPVGTAIEAPAAATLVGEASAG